MVHILGVSAQQLKPEGGSYLVRDKDWTNQIRRGKELMVRSQVSLRDLSAMKTLDLYELFVVQVKLSGQMSV